MKLYKNPPLLLRLLVIAAGLFLCILAGVGGSIVWLGVGLGICVFVCAWGDREYIGLLRKGLLKLKDAVLGAIGFMRK